MGKYTFDQCRLKKRIIHVYIIVNMFSNIFVNIRKYILFKTSGRLTVYINKTVPNSLTENNATPVNVDKLETTEK